jgi:hypothetical protein
MRSFFSYGNVTRIPESGGGRLIYGNGRCEIISVLGPHPFRTNGPHIVQTMLLARRRANAVPGIAHLMIVKLGQIVRRVEIEDMNVEAADGA